MHVCIVSKPNSKSILSKSRHFLQPWLGPFISNQVHSRYMYRYAQINSGYGNTYNLIVVIFHSTIGLTSSTSIYVIFCAIWYHLYNLKNVKNTHGGVTLLRSCFSRFLNYTNGTKLSNASHTSVFWTFEKLKKNRWNKKVLWINCKINRDILQSFHKTC